MHNLITIRQHKLALFIIIGSSLLYIVPTQVRPANFMQDDSYFYLQVASNIVEGHGSTFHRVTPTNGYHPLWLVLSVLSIALAGGNKQTGLHITFIIQILLSLGTMFFLYRISKQVSLKYWSLGLAIVVAYLLGTGVYGSEAHINAATLSACIYFFLLSLSKNEYRNWIVAGLLFGLTILARLDNVFVAITLIGFGALMDVRNGRAMNTVKRLAVLSLAATAVLMPYLLYNQLVYDHFIPISGSIKSIFPRVVVDSSNLGRVGYLTTVLGLLAIIAVLVFKTEELRRTLFLGLGTGVLLHASYVVLFTDHYTFWPWYYVPGVITAGLAISHFFEVVAGIIGRIFDQKIIRYMAATFSILLIIAGGFRAWLKAEVFDTVPDALTVNQFRWPDELAIWMRDNLPADSLIFVYDWPGAIAYYSDLRILPMDGLMNDFQYNEDLLTMGINKYLCDRQVKYYLGPMEEDMKEFQEVEVAAPLYRQPAGKMVIEREDIVIEVKSVVTLPDKTPLYAIWAIAGQCSDS